MFNTVKIHMYGNERQHWSYYKCLLVRHWTFLGCHTRMKNVNNGKIIINKMENFFFKKKYEQNDTVEYLFTIQYNTISWTEEKEIWWYRKENKRKKKTS